MPGLKGWAEIACDVKETLHKWIGGVHWSNSGYHSHIQPDAIRPGPHGKRELGEILEHHPDAKPLELAHGIRTLNGHTKPAAEIDPAFKNHDRLTNYTTQISVSGKHSKRKQGPDTMSELKSFTEAHPGFIVQITADPLVVCVRTEWMMKMAVHEEYENHVNGVLSDGAHGFFKDGNEILMTSSVYSRVHSRWVPALFSYLSGQTARHFKCHFLVLFNGTWMALKAHKEFPATLEEMHCLIVNVVDFSLAQREGFIQAYVEFCQRWAFELSDVRSDQERREAAMKLLKGCAQHFRSGITRAKNVVDPVDQEEFIQSMLALTEAEDLVTMKEQGKKIVDRFKDTAAFVLFWTSNLIGPMLLRARRLMDEKLWDSTPNSTNAQESFHYWLYRAIGIAHSVFSGLDGLFRVAMHFESQFLDLERGIRVKYGSVKAPPETSGTDMGLGINQSLKLADGADDMTNPTEIKPGRAPDTISELRGNKKFMIDGQVVDTSTPALKSPTKTRTKAFSSSPSKSSRKRGAVPGSPKKRKVGSPEKASQLAVAYWGRPGCTIDEMSCWLDTSLQLLEAAFEHLGIEMEIQKCIEDLPESPLKRLFEDLMGRAQTSVLDSEATRSFNETRSALRDDLFELGIINAKNEPQTLFGWLPGLIQSTRQQELLVGSAGRLSTLCVTLELSYRMCYGHALTAGTHYDIQRRASWQGALPQLDGEQCNWDVGVWFEQYFLPFVGAKAVESTCWRNTEQVQWCRGRRHDAFFKCSMPVILLLEFVQEEAYHEWKIPTTLELSKSEKLHYELVGIAFRTWPKSKNDIAHFTCQYWHKGDGYLYIYGDQENGGHAEKRTGVSFAQRGRYQAGKRAHEAVYVLSGGFKSQDRFYDMRVKELLKKKLKMTRAFAGALPELTLEDPAFRVLESEHRDWLLNPHNERSQEYVRATKVRDVENSDMVREQVETLMRWGKGQKCPCGIKVKAHSKTDLGTAVQCWECKSWLHDACLRRGKAGLVGEGEFRCDICRYGHGASSLPEEECTCPGALQNIWKVEEELQDRLRVGIACLAPCGNFFYPVRLIRLLPTDDVAHRKWIVKWFRGSHLVDESGQQKPGETSVEEERDLINHLWNNQAGRRESRLGYWPLACRMADTRETELEKMLTFAPEFEEALGPHIHDLRRMMVLPTNYPHDVPAWQPTTGLMLPVQAPLTTAEYQMLNDWMLKRLCIKKELYRKTFMHEGRVRVHAITLLVAYRLKKKSKVKREVEWKEWLSRAWAVQRKADLEKGILDKQAASMDEVDRKCVADLERLMFDCRERAGLAGARQWGLDAGYHQNNWNPYEAFDQDTCETTEEADWQNTIVAGNYEKRGKEYIEWVSTTESSAPAQTKPKPRMRRSSDPVAAALTHDQKIEHLIQQVWCLDKEGNTVAVDISSEKVLAGKKVIEEKVEENLKEEESEDSGNNLKQRPREVNTEVQETITGVKRKLQAAGLGTDCSDLSNAEPESEEETWAAAKDPVANAKEKVALKTIRTYGIRRMSSRKGKVVQRG
ncbi:hypothetical protein NP233_g8597 [Leucocoprinus birnbaumii]|uniref:Zinc finger PHD-type domain-containing protein n=1 Tax=Leucocoprinus birnbaumii TaxID=56174 RepID=A0AAD5VM02_9AGAR|nr:hypothetical protein NP233_g8597 [Leucocoprinus birnbaumii]